MFKNLYMGVRIDTRLSSFRCVDLKVLFFDFPINNRLYKYIGSNLTYTNKFYLITIQEFRCYDSYKI